MNAPFRSRWLLWLVFVLPLAAVAPSAAAQQQAEPNYYTKQHGISTEQAANIARRKTGGRVLSITPASKGGQRGYNVRVLIDGKRVKQYYVDSDGRISSH
jgi:uncharacterized membrane protein YkoI